MYRLAEVKQLPETLRVKHGGKHVFTLRDFLSGRMMAAQVTGIKPGDYRKTYNGLLMAARRPEFRGMVAVKRRNGDIYLIRQG